MIEYVDCAWRNPLEQTGDNTAKEMTDCNYPCCEECEHFSTQTCDVPIVLSKENWHILTEKIARLEKLTEEIEKSLYDEILGVNKEVSKGLPSDYDTYVDKQVKIITAVKLPPLEEIEKNTTDYMRYWIEKGENIE